MTKKELIKALENYDDDTEIVLEETVSDPWSGHIYKIRLKSIEISKDKKIDKRFFKILEGETVETIEIF